MGFSLFSTRCRQLVFPHSTPFSRGTALTTGVTARGSTVLRARPVPPGLVPCKRCAIPPWAWEGMDKCEGCLKASPDAFVQFQGIGSAFSKELHPGAQGGSGERRAVRPRRPETSPPRCRPERQSELARARGAPRHPAQLTSPGSLCTPARLLHPAACPALCCPPSATCPARLRSLPGGVPSAPWCPHSPALPLPLPPWSHPLAACCRGLHYWMPPLAGAPTLGCRASGLGSPRVVWPGTWGDGLGPPSASWEMEFSLQLSAWLDWSSYGARGSAPVGRSCTDRPGDVGLHGPGVGAEGVVWTSCMWLDGLAGGICINWLFGAVWTSPGGGGCTDQLGGAGACTQKQWPRGFGAHGGMRC